MDLVDRIYTLHRILRDARRPVARLTLQEKLGGCSRATVKRVIDDLKDYLGAPIEYDRKHNGYYYAKHDGAPYELPGLWLNPSEIYALLVTQQLLANVQPGLLDAHLAPLRQRIEGILHSRHLGKGELERRVRILHMAARKSVEHFSLIASALLQRRRLHIHYHGRERDVLTTRTVSPQRLTHYRDNWYLDAWCHSKKALRSFSLDRIRQAHALPDVAKDIPDVRLNAHYASAYGIFAGTPRHTAVLRFSAARARWVADEQWHPQQLGTWLADGRYELRIPYSDARELMMDILKHGAGVEVLRPTALRRHVSEELHRTCKQYEI